MKIIIFALIPLILSIWITPAFSLQPEDIDTESKEGKGSTFFFTIPKEGKE